MSTFENKRTVPRYSCNARCFAVTYAEMPVLDMSVRGISFLGNGFSQGDVVNLWLIATTLEREVVETLCEIVGVIGDRVAATFVNKTETLENFILAHAAEPV